MHIDVNSAFLSWEAVYKLQHGHTFDLRKIPSVIGGSQATRHEGVVHIYLRMEFLHHETCSYDLGMECPHHETSFY